MDEVARGRRRTKWLWLIGILAAFVLNCFSLWSVLDTERLWLDSENHDTRTLLRETRKQDDFWRWFHHDWPLGNGFYRPIPTASFIADDAIFGNNLNLYRLTNWLIGLACVYLLMWYVWELFHSVWGAIGSALVFSLWQSTITASFPVPFQDLGMYAALIVLALGCIPGVGRFGRALMVAGLLVFLGRELSAWVEHMDIVSATFAFRNIAWPPGRTATLMTLFTLPCLAAYCKFERSGRWPWAAFSLAMLALAFLTYEQVVVVPAALLATAMALWLQGVRVHWKLHLLPWAMLLIYASLHKIYLHDTRYKRQAYRGTTGGWRDIWAWILPSTFELKFMGAFINRDVGLFFVFNPNFWLYFFQIAGNVLAYIEARKVWVPAAFGLLVSLGTFLPMAFQHPLAHYYYLPMCFRAIFIAWLLWLAGKEILNVASPRAFQPQQTPVPEPR